MNDHSMIPTSITCPHTPLLLFILSCYSDKCGWSKIAILLTKDSLPVKINVNFAADFNNVQFLPCPFI